MLRPAFRKKGIFREYRSKPSLPTLSVYNSDKGRGRKDAAKRKNMLKLKNTPQIVSKILFLGILSFNLSASPASGANDEEIAQQIKNLSPAQQEELQRRLQAYGQESQQLYGDTAQDFLEVQKKHALLRRDSALLEEKKAGSTEQGLAAIAQDMSEMEKQMKELETMRQQGQDQLQKIRGGYEEIVRKTLQEFEEEKQKQRKPIST